MRFDRERLAEALCLANSGPFEFLSPAGQDAIRSEVTAILADIEAQGFVIVPKVPTPEMVDRFVSRALCVSFHGDGGWSNYAMEQWKTMIEAGKEKR